MPRWLNRWKAKASELQTEVHTLYLVSRDPRCPWYVKALAGGVVAYAVSPIDLIPDFIPIFGVLDDLLVIPLGIWLLLRIIPKSLMVENRKKAIIQEHSKTGLKVVGAIVVLRWIFCVAALFVLQHWARHHYRKFFHRH